MFDAVLDASLTGKARKKGLIAVHAHNLRRWTEDRHQTTDDYPYGGGAGMVMKVEPFHRAVTDLKQADPRPCRVILMTPQGALFDHATAERLSKEERLVILCGRYEGYDERVRLLADEEISLGDYVLTGGELAAMVVVDAVTRLVPGVVGDEASTRHDSHAHGLLEHPHYTRPAEYEGMRVPDILLEGHHAKIEAWRRRESIIRTARRRPDLLAGADLTDNERVLAERIVRGEERT
ncbi:MAG: tRNA (guanosine(37)-N1)-methyltransferase TrmD [Nitrospinae bacterium]|nr:tRNA (guanosine(37)-N1)-methyltransferase TrmD [Nitrospinota bacterium]